MNKALFLKGSIIMKRIAVIDCDIIAFRCAAANESRSIKATHNTTGQVSEHPHRTGFKEHIKGLFESSEFTIEDLQHPGDIKFAFHAINTTINALKESCKADDVELFISGTDNFRDFLPLPSKYKGDRRGKIKPVQLKECREYLINKKGAVVVNGNETDDRLAQRCYEGVKEKAITIACTIDGDQQGVDGWMYNWIKMSEPKLVKGFGYVELIKDNKDFDGYGRKFFYAQWVLGDSTDCFKPSEISGKKFGVVAMYKLLDECKTDKECVEAIYKQYKTWYPSVVEYTDWTGVIQKTDAIGLMDLYASCCHMQRFKNDYICTKTLLTKLGINYE